MCKNVSDGFRISDLKEVFGDRPVETFSNYVEQIFGKKVDEIFDDLGTPLPRDVYDLVMEFVYNLVNFDEADVVVRTANQCVEVELQVIPDTDPSTLEVESSLWLRLVRPLGEIGPFTLDQVRVIWEN